MTQEDTCFSEDEKNNALSCFLNFNTLLDSFHAASWTPCSCHSVYSWDWSSNLRVLGLRWWGLSGQIIPYDGFWSRMSAWRTTTFVNFTHLIGFRTSELFRKIDEDFGGSIHRPIVVYSMSRMQRISSFYRVTHSSSTWLLFFCHHSFWTCR